jgi:crotonobetainyl-CoA:carnitine CoA-transferase CaiB-like acyl-CoA transferase
MKVLDGIRVVDLSRAPAGPRCAQLIADFGADVIKERGPGGDENRGWRPDGQSPNFASVNRGKHGVGPEDAGDQGHTAAAGRGCGCADP